MQLNLSKLQKRVFSKKEVDKAPEIQGVYIFFGKQDEPIYIGKAKNLKNRLYSYTQSDLPIKTKKMLSEANDFAYIKVTSELEALLLEANLVRMFMPRFNVQLKDDKHALYIKITNDRYPIVTTARRLESETNMKKVFGPFPSSSNVKAVLRMLRKITPFATHLPDKRRCLYAHIGLCNPCPSVIEKEETNLKVKLYKDYQKNIKTLINILSGRFNFVMRDFEKSMRFWSKMEKYEEANEIKQKIEILRYITQPITPINYFLADPTFSETTHDKEVNELLTILEKITEKKISSLNRIECFDIAHLAGSNPTASMVTFVQGEPDKNLYRHFKIRQKKGNDDISSMREVAERRKRYLSTWGTPDLIIVDGGKAQVKYFSESFGESNILIVGLAKRYETLVYFDKKRNVFREQRVNFRNALNLVQRARDEAHRFARRYHHKLVIRDLLEEGK